MAVGRVSVGNGRNLCILTQYHHLQRLDEGSQCTAFPLEPFVSRSSGHHSVSCRAVVGP